VLGKNTASLVTLNYSTQFNFEYVHLPLFLLESRVFGLWLFNSSCLWTVNVDSVKEVSLFLNLRFHDCWLLYFTH